MIAIKTHAENWTTEFLLGQVKSMVVLEVETLPSYSHTVLTDTRFTQRCVPGKFGETMTYDELNAIRAMLDDLGDCGMTAGSLGELMLLKQVTDAELALVALYEEMLSNG